MAIAYIWLLNLHSIPRGFFCFIFYYWASLPWAEPINILEQFSLILGRSQDDLSEYPTQYCGSTSGTTDHFWIYNSLSNRVQLWSLYNYLGQIREPSGCFAVKTRLKVLSLTVPATLPNSFDFEQLTKLKPSLSIQNTLSNLDYKDTISQLIAFPLIELFQQFRECIYVLIQFFISYGV